MSCLIKMATDGGGIKEQLLEHNTIGSSMPNKTAKQNKRNRILLNKKLQSQGRTANQVVKKRLKQERKLNG